VVKAAKRGERHPDEVAVLAGREYAEVCVHPGPGWWLSRTATAAKSWVLIGLAVLLALEAVVARLTGDPGWLSWSLGALAVLVALLGVFLVLLQRDCRKLLSLPPAASGEAPGAG